MTSNQPLPEEYVDGYVIFMGRRFIVDPRALIPRFETEELVKYCLKFLQENPHIHTVADIGTGSGIIPISLLEKTERPLKVFASDMSQEALSLAQENVSQIQSTKYKVQSEGITFLQ
jgi:release factor glutamine methyltransferase